MAFVGQHGYMAMLRETICHTLGQSAQSAHLTEPKPRGIFYSHLLKQEIV
jgi:hypothetical protein